MASSIYSHQHLIGPALVAGGHAETGVTSPQIFTLTTADERKCPKSSLAFNDFIAQRCGYLCAFGGLAAQVDWLGLGVGGHPALSLHSSHKPGELSQ